MSKKYIFLYNLLNDGDNFETQMVNKLEIVIPEIVIKPFSIVNHGICEGASIWVPEEKYLMA